MREVRDTPRTMRAVRLDEIGAPENLKVVDMPVPEIGADDVLIRVELAGLIYGDTEARRGTYFVETRLPWFPGREAAGVVEAVGANVREHRPGDRVIALVLAGGCCAEFVRASKQAQTLPNGYRIPPSDIITLPDNVSFAQGLPYLVNFRLAYLLFHGSSKVPPGATVLVHGASGGMGSMVVQLAHRHGCRIIATCRTTSEAAFCKKLGADHVIDVTSTDYATEVMRITDGEGAVFSFNSVGGDTLNTDAQVLAPFGEIQAYGYVAGKKPFDVFAINKTISVKTFSADDFLRTSVFAAATAAMHDWFATGRLLEVETILPLAQVAEANRRLEQGEIIGKIALQP